MARKRKTNSTEWWQWPACPTTRQVAKAARAQAQQAGKDPDLAEDAAVIRRLSLRCLRDSIEMGRRLTRDKVKVGHGRWGEWLADEFDWSQDTASNLINLYKFFQDGKFRTVRNLENLNLPLNALYLLARKSTPEAVRDAVLERAEAGEKITTADVKALLANEPDEGKEPEEPKSGKPKDSIDAHSARFRNDLLEIANEVEDKTKIVDGEVKPELAASWRREMDLKVVAASKSAGHRLLKVGDLIEKYISNEPESAQLSLPLVFPVRPVAGQDAQEPEQALAA
jgi:hypothetical protein